MSRPLKGHWESICDTRKPNRVRRRVQEALLTVIERSYPRTAEASLIDIGGGASPLSLQLWRRGVRDLTVVDASLESLELAKRLYGNIADRITWIHADIAALPLPRSHYFFWHDQAFFQSITEPAGRRAYLKKLRFATRPHAFVILSSNSQTESRVLLQDLSPDFQLLESIGESGRQNQFLFQRAPA